MNLPSAFASGGAVHPVSHGYGPSSAFANGVPILLISPAIADSDVQRWGERFTVATVASLPVLAIADAQPAATQPINAIAIARARRPGRYAPVLATAEADCSSTVAMQMLNAGDITPNQPAIAASGVQRVSEQFVAAAVPSLPVFVSGDAQPAATQLPSASAIETSLHDAVCDAGVAEGVGQPAVEQITAGVDVQEHVSVEGEHAVPYNLSKQLSSSAEKLGEAGTVGM